MLEMQAILTAMQTSGVWRLVISSTVGAADPNDLPDVQFKLLIAIIKTSMRSVYEEIINIARLVRDCDLDWTIVRGSMPNNQSGTGSVRTGYLGRKQVGTKLARTDLARFMLAQVQDSSCLRQVPAISN